SKPRSVQTPPCGRFAQPSGLDCCIAVRATQNGACMEVNMRKLLVVGVLFMAVGALAVQAAVASTSGAHFMSATSSVNNSGALVVSWDEAGLGNENINYTLTADATATYACINNGGDPPQAGNKDEGRRA